MVRKFPGILTNQFYKKKFFHFVCGLLSNTYVAVKVLNVNLICFQVNLGPFGSVLKRKLVKCWRLAFAEFKVLALLGSSRINISQNIISRVL